MSLRGDEHRRGERSRSPRGSRGRRRGGPYKEGQEGPGVAQQRSLVHTKRLLGTVLDWRNKYGWIQPSAPIDHPAANRHGGKVFLAAEDVQEEIEAGLCVTFFAFIDSNGIGAMNVRRAAEGAISALAQLENTKAAVPPEPSPEAIPPELYGGYRREPRRVVVRANLVQVLERLHRTMFNAVSEAIKNCDSFRMEREWSQEDTVRRILKYFSKAGQSPELLGIPWPEAADQFVEHAMHCYSAGCGDRPWFFDLDISSAVCAGLWVILRESSAIPRATLPELERKVVAKYEEMMDDILLDKAMWDIPTATFGEVDPARKKIAKNLKMSHEAAMTEVRANDTLTNDRERVQCFVKTWMENSIGRTWMAIDNAEELFTVERLVELFSCLVAPFGEDHPFSCVPAKLTNRIGRPPKTWPFLEECAVQVLRGCGVVAFPRRPTTVASGSASGGLRALPWYDAAASAPPKVEDDSASGGLRALPWFDEAAEMGRFEEQMALSEASVRPVPMKVEALANGGAEAQSRYAARGFLHTKQEDFRAA